MKKLLIALTGATCLSLFSQASAQIIAEETFDYTSGSLLSATGAAPGWSTGWKADPALTTNLGADYDVFPGSLNSSAYQSQGLSPVGNQFRIEDSAAMYRGLDAPIDWDSNSTFYFSTLVRWSGNNSSAASRMFFQLGSSQIRFGLQADGTNANEMRLSIRNAGDAFGSTNFAAAANQSDREATAFTYMLVAKVVTVTAGNDTISLSLYEPSDTLPSTEPLTWDVTNDGAQTGTADYIGFDSVLFSTGRTTGFDEFRIGDSFAAVTVPEPTSVAMLLGAAGLLFIRRRRS